MAGYRASVPVVHVTRAADGRYLIEVRADGETTALETQPTREAAAQRAADWIGIYRAHPKPAWHDEALR